MAKQINDTEKRAKIISMLFAAFRQGSDAESMAVYVEMLKDVPVDILDLACRKSIKVRKYLPAIAEILEDAQSLVAEANGTSELPFAEVWKEILQQIDKTYFDWEEPQFSRAEIKQLVDAFGGLHELRMMETKEVPIIRSQMKAMYEGICKRNREKAANESVLGFGSTVLIGDGDSARWLLK